MYKSICRIYLLWYNIHRNNNKHIEEKQMDIVKSDMLKAWENREKDPKAMNELVMNFYELAEFFANKAAIASYYRDDYIDKMRKI